MRITQLIVAVIITWTINNGPVEARDALRQKVEGNVTWELADYAGSKYLIKHYGNYELVDNVTYFDIDRNPKVYAYIYSKRPDISYVPSEISLEVEKYTQEVFELNLLLRQSQDENEKIEIRKKLFESENNRIMRDRFITIIVDATKFDKPIIHSYHGLPIPVRQLPFIEGKLESQNPGLVIDPIEVVFLSKLDYLILYTGPRNDVVALNLASSESMTRQQIESQFTSQIKPQNYPDRISVEWNLIEKELMNEPINSHKYK